MVTRRQILHTAVASGALSMLPHLTFAAAPTDKRLVIIVLRGGMDGLDVVQPWGDPEFRIIRPADAKTAPAGAFAINDFFALHNALTPVKPLLAAREFTAVHAVCTPYRERSHFAAQDYLERGADALSVPESGWINRLVGRVGNRRIDFAADIGTGSSLILRGPAQYLNVAPERDLGFWRDSVQFLELLYADDAQFQATLNTIKAGEAESTATGNVDPGISAREVCGLAARMLKQDCRIAVFSLYGWDTHVGQTAMLNKSLGELATAIITLKTEVGPVWQDTAVVAVSEFGRTARFNGATGTDHGTGNAVLFAGGLLANGRGGKIDSAGWPGLGEGKLLDDRDLAPVDDVRRYLGWLIAEMFDLAPSSVSRDIFPGTEMGAKTKLI
jgi:uncharacterized protein (DUF1501 family)